MAHVEFTLVNSILQPKVDGRLLPVKLDVQQVAQAKRAGHLTAFLKDSILRKLRRELHDQPGLNEALIARIMRRFEEALE